MTLVRETCKGSYWDFGFLIFDFGLMRQWRSEGHGGTRRWRSQGCPPRRTADRPHRRTATIDQCQAGLKIFPPCQGGTEGGCLTNIERRSRRMDRRSVPQHQASPIRPYRVSRTQSSQQEAGIREQESGTSRREAAKVSHNRLRPGLLAIAGRPRFAPHAVPPVQIPHLPTAFPATSDSGRSEMERTADFAEGADDWIAACFIHSRKQNCSRRRLRTGDTTVAPGALSFGLCSLCFADVLGAISQSIPNDGSKAPNTKNNSQRMLTLVRGWCKGNLTRDAEAVRRIHLSLTDSTS